MLTSTIHIQVSCTEVPGENGVVANAERGKPRLGTKKAKLTAIGYPSSIFTTQKW